MDNETWINIMNYGAYASELNWIAVDNSELGSAPDDDIVYAEFEEIGIYFTFNKIKEEDQIVEVRQNEMYLHKEPVEIVIGRIGTAY